MSYELDYTKGEWFVFGEKYFMIESKNNHPRSTVTHPTIATVNTGFIDFKVAEANAKLIAAAPKMFELLKESLSILEWFMENTIHQDGDIESFFNIGANQIEQTKQLLTEITK